uniref:Uncharacterized protein n=1 Tax=Molossus molossus TaxID=27622 RepID=A0A7J8C8L1_MOLMO|nr:hypothetical protein HJG59_009878 [Molossus molossus]
MSQKPQSSQQTSQSDLLPEDPNNTQDETQDPSSVTHSPMESVQDLPSIICTRRVSIQEPLPTAHTRRISIQEHPPTVHTHLVSIQEHPPSVHTRRTSIQEPPAGILTRRVSTQEPPASILTRRVSTQEPPASSLTRRVSIQEPPASSLTRRVSIQEPPASSLTRRVSIQEPSASSLTRRVSIQEPPASTLTNRASIQEPPASTLTRRVSIQEPPASSLTRRVSIQEPSPIIHTRRVSIQEPPSFVHTPLVSIEEMPSFGVSSQIISQDTQPASYGSSSNNQDIPLGFQTRRLSAQKPCLLTHVPLTSIESVAYSSNINFQDDLSSTESHHSGLQGSKLPVRANVDVPPSITYSPEASIESMESILWNSQENFKDSLYKFQFRGSSLDNIPTNSSTETSFYGFQDGHRRRQSQLPLGRRLLHEAKKISRQLSLVLSLAGMMIISLITLGQPWMHFQVPLTPPGDPAGPLTMPINTIFFVRCSDISCRKEHDKNAYLLDFAWAFLLIATITGFCVCFVLIDTIFFTSSNLSILDFSGIVISILTGANMILGILFYLMQAHEYLQEGMTYRLGCSFYLVFFST